MWRLRPLLLLTVMALAVAGFGAGASVGHAATTTTVAANYDYDHPIVLAHGGALRAHDAFPDIAWAARRSSGIDLAAKAGAGADEAFHYTRSQYAAVIEKEGLRPGSYLTKRGDLSPLQAQIDLALPPNRGLPNALIRIDLAGLRKAGYDMGEFTKVGRKYNMPGGGTELRFGKAILPQFVTVVRR